MSHRGRGPDEHFGIFMYTNNMSGPRHRAIPAPTPPWRNNAGPSHQRAAAKPAPGDAIFLSVVIPAYNEEKRLPHTLKAVTTYLLKQNYTWEVAVVDDGSKDATADLVRAANIVEPRVRLLQYGSNHGKGYAVRYGMTHAHGKYRVFMDADNSTTLDQVEHMLPFFKM